MIDTANGNCIQSTFPNDVSHPGLKAVIAFNLRSLMVFIIQVLKAVIEFNLRSLMVFLIQI